MITIIIISLIISIIIIIITIIIFSLIIIIIIIDKDFSDYFSKWGIVKDAVVMIDKNTYASRGFGFVTFELESSVDKVLREGHAIKGKYIECKRAEPKGFYGGGPMDGGKYTVPETAISTP